MLDNFAIFILTHGRPDNVLTYKTIMQAGYTGKVYIIIDNEDDTAARYYENYGDKVIVFDKEKVAESFDEGDNFGDRRTVIYARNACFDIAKELGLVYFMQLDDDYLNFRYKMDGNYQYCDKLIHKNLDNVIGHLLDYYKVIPAKCIAIAQVGDFIGAEDNEIHKSVNLRRKCMNTLICSTERPFKFVGRINEDVNTYVWYQSLGNLFMTFPLLAIQQKETQSNIGGMTEMYLDTGTYIKSFYTVMYAPSCVKVGMMGIIHPRLHHRVSWDNAVPCIISEEYRNTYIKELS